MQLAAADARQLWCEMKEISYRWRAGIPEFLGAASAPPSFRTGQECRGAERHQPAVAVGLLGVFDSLLHSEAGHAS